jgi:hypothetical protein
MSQFKHAEIADTVYFWMAANDSTGTAGDGATPLFDVRLAGAAANAAPTASGTPTLLSHADYSNGLHEIAIDTTGYAAGEYAVFCTLTISTVNPAGFCGSFKLRTAGTATDSAIQAIKTKTDYLPSSAPATQAELVTAIEAGTVLAKAAELAKVPKSDSTVTWNATALASIQSEAQDAITASALATAAQLPALALTTGTVLTGGGNNTASSFYTNLAGVDNFWNDALILITSGALAGQVKEIGDFTDVNGVVTLTTGQAFTGIPADDVTFTVINR